MGNGYCTMILCESSSNYIASKWLVLSRKNCICKLMAEHFSTYYIREAVKVPFVEKTLMLCGYYDPNVRHLSAGICLYTVVDIRLNQLL